MNLLVVMKNGGGYFAGVTEKKEFVIFTYVGVVPRGLWDLLQANEWSSLGATTVKRKETGEMIDIVIKGVGLEEMEAETSLRAGDKALPFERDDRIAPPAPG